MGKTSQELDRDATSHLSKMGFNADGTPKRKKQPKAQIAFERMIIMTPMGNRMR